MGQNLQKTQKSPATVMNNLLTSDKMQELIQGSIKDNADLFSASVLELYGSEPGLQKCDPGLVIKEALKAATLKLPLNKNLGFAWLVPRWNSKQKAFIPQFQPGWKGIVQLAQRTGQYKTINCGVVYEGELRKISKLTGELDIEGEQVSETIIGYFAHFQLINGFKKESYWSKAKVEAHVLKYNQESKKAGKIVGNWAEFFDDRAQTTVLKHLISKYGIMSVEVLNAVAAEETTAEEEAGRQIAANANTKEIGFEDVSGNGADNNGAPEGVDPKTGEVTETADEPGY